MRLKSGEVLHLPQSNAPVPGYTVSEQVWQEHGMALYLFSLAAGTNISAECYDYHKVLQVLDGELEVFTADGRHWNLTAGMGFVTERELAVGMQSKTGCVYAELALRKDAKMNDLIKAGEVFALKELLPYQEGRILNMDLTSNSHMKFVLMSFAEGTGLSEHAAPGEALVFALDGEAVIGYEGRDYTVRAGETFKFDKLGRHSVMAKGNFKMALLLVLD